MTAGFTSDGEITIGALRVAGLPPGEVEALARSYRADLARERQGCGLAGGRARWQNLTKHARRLRHALYMPPDALAASGLADQWPAAAAACAEAAGAALRLAEEALDRLDAFRVKGGPRPLSRHLGPRPILGLALGAAEALAARGLFTPGRLADLVSTVHAHVTGDAEDRGVARAVREAIAARGAKSPAATSKKKISQQQDDPMAAE